VQSSTNRTEKETKWTNEVVEWAFPDNPEE